MKRCNKCGFRNIDFGLVLGVDEEGRACGVPACPKCGSTRNIEDIKVNVQRRGCLLFFLTIGVSIYAALRAREGSGSDGQGEDRSATGRRFVV